jgi:hypothetical protein
LSELAAGAAGIGEMLCPDLLFAAQKIGKVLHGS